MKIKLSIIILSWNTKKLLKQCLDSVIENGGELGGNRMEVIVVDNGSTDGSVEMVNEFSGLTSLKKKIPQPVNSLTRNNLIIKLIENKQNLGYAKGNNVGIKAAEGELVMILNSDAIVKKGTSQKLVNFLNKHEEVAVVGPKLLNMDGTPQANCGRFPNLFVSAVMLFLEHYGGRQMVRFSPAKSGYVDWLMGAAFMARKAGFDKIGGFDEALFMYMEEVDWFYRLREAGMKAYFLKEAEIVHLGLGSSTSGKKEPILNIYRGLIHFYKKHYNFISLIILRVMLKLKAAAALLLGYLTGNRYLKETYEEAFKLA